MYIYVYIIYIHVCLCKGTAEWSAYTRIGRNLGPPKCDVHSKEWLATSFWSQTQSSKFDTMQTMRRIVDTIFEGFQKIQYGYRFSTSIILVENMAHMKSQCLLTWADLKWELTTLAGILATAALKNKRARE